MRKFVSKKALGYFGLFAIVVFSLFLPLLIAKSAQAIKVSKQELPQIDQSQISNLPAIAPGSITAEFVNRNQIRVTLPAVLPYPSAGLTLNDMFGGIYTDTKNEDTIEYVKLSNSTSPGWGGIDYFTDGGAMVSAIENPNHMAQANVADIRSFELTIAFVESPGQNRIHYLSANGTWVSTSSTSGSSAYETNLHDASTYKIVPQKPENFNIVARYNNDSIVTFEEDSQEKYNFCTGDSSFRLDCSKNDQDYLTLLGTLEQLQTSTGVVDMKFAKSGAVIKVAGGQNSTNGQVSGVAPDENPDDSCESAGGALGWIICPAILAMDAALNWLDTQIQALLSINNEAYDNPGMRQAWANLRNIAYFLLIPTMLIMVIGTALGVSALDAYTVKKAMPRLLIAVVFIALSFEICTFLIEFTNVVGAGVIGLLTAPFNGTAGLPTDTTVATLSLADLYDINSVLSSFATSGVIAVAGAILLFLFYGPLLLGVIIAFLILILRQLFIIGLILAAPLAILAWIFPGNDAPWKLWRLSFTKLLIMYPLIMAIIALGRIFSVIVNSTGGTGFLKPLMILIAFIIPYVFIPATFKFAGGFFANLTGMVNDRSKGLFENMRKKRADKVQRMKNEAVVPKNWVGAKAINKAATWAVAPHKNLAYGLRDKKVPFVSASGRRLATSIENSVSEQSAELFKELNANGANDKTYRALGGMYRGFSKETKQRLIEDGFATATQNPDGTYDLDTIQATRSLKTEADINKFANILDREGNEHNATELIAATALRNNASRIASSHIDPKHNYESVASAAALGLGQHGFLEDTDVQDVGRLMMREGMSLEATNSALVQAELQGKNSHPEIKPGYGHVIKDGQIVAGLSAEGGRAEAVVKTVKSWEWSAAKTQAVTRSKGAIINVAKPTIAAPPPPGSTQQQIDEYQAKVADQRADAAAMKKVIANGVISASDPGTQKEWVDIAQKVFTQDELDSIYSTATGYTGGPPASGGTAGGAPTSGSGRPASGGGGTPSIP